MFLVDGFRTIFGFSALPGVFLREREVQTPELDGGGPIDTTTMLNVNWRTNAAKSLKTLGELTAQCQYDPFVYSQIITTLLNANNLITMVFPDAATMTFWGFLNKFTPAPKKEGDFPLAEIKVVPTHRNGVPFQGIVAEAGPVVVGGNNVGFVVR
jgi:hypothetical protein